MLYNQTLPRFIGKILDRKWACYLEHVYGESVLLRAGEVLDVSKFEILYTHILSECDINVEVYKLPGRKPPYSPSSGRKRCCTPKGAIHFNSVLTLGYGQFFAPLPEHTWVEITHCTRGLVEAGYWVYALRGSGVYMNTGRTIGFDQHGAALRGVLAPKGLCRSVRCNDFHVGGRDDFWKTMHPLHTEMSRRGYNSVQFLRPEVYRKTPMELFFTGVSGTHVCGPNVWRVHSGLHLRTGYRASRPFSCDPHANCTTPRTIKIS